MGLVKSYNKQTHTLNFSHETNKVIHHGMNEELRNAREGIQPLLGTDLIQSLFSLQNKMKRSQLCAEVREKTTPSHRNGKGLGPAGGEAR